MKFISVLLLFLSFSFGIYAGNLVEIKDSVGRIVKIPEKIDRIICSGPGALRLIVYLNLTERVIAVDGMEKRKSKYDFRPYAIANPDLKDLPLFGEFRGHDNPELIMSLNPSPQVIFKTYTSMGYNPDKLEKKTGIPVIVLKYGDLLRNRKDFFNSLKIIGRASGKEKRAEELIKFFNNQIKELKSRTSDIDGLSKNTCYIGGVAFKGPHGFQSTQPLYPPFEFIGAKNVAKLNKKGNSLNNSMVSKESLINWNPDILFVDLSTLQMGEKSNALNELKTDKAYKILTAVTEKKIFFLIPYNWYTTNYGSLLADSWFAGKILYPEKFKEINPRKKADEIYSFLFGKPVFSKLNKRMKNLIFTRMK